MIFSMGVTVLIGKAVGAGTPQDGARVVAGQIRLFLAVTAALTAALP